MWNTPLQEQTRNILPSHYFGGGELTVAFFVCFSCFLRLFLLQDCCDDAESGRPHRLAGRWQREYGAAAPPAVVSTSLACNFFVVFEWV